MSLNEVIGAMCRLELNVMTKATMKANLRVQKLEQEIDKPMNVHRWRALEVRIRNSDHYRGVSRCMIK